MRAKFKYPDRKLIEQKLKNGESILDITRFFRCNRCTMTLEINRGLYNGSYSADVAQRRWNGEEV